MLEDERNVQLHLCTVVDNLDSLTWGHNNKGIFNRERYQEWLILLFFWIFSRETRFEYHSACIVCGIITQNGIHSFSETNEFYKNCCGIINMKNSKYKFLLIWIWFKHESLMKDGIKIHLLWITIYCGKSIEGWNNETLLGTRSSMSCSSLILVFWYMPSENSIIRSTQYILAWNCQRII